MDIMDFTRNVFHSRHLCSRELPVFFSMGQPHPLPATGMEIPSHLGLSGLVLLTWPLEPHHVQKGYSFSVALKKAGGTPERIFKLLNAQMMYLKKTVLHIEKEYPALQVLNPSLLVIIILMAQFSMTHLFVYKTLSCTLIYFTYIL